MIAVDSSLSTEVPWTNVVVPCHTSVNIIFHHRYYLLTAQTWQTFTFITSLWLSAFTAIIERECKAVWQEALLEANRSQLSSRLDTSALVYYNTPGMVGTPKDIGTLIAVVLKAVSQPPLTTLQPNTTTNKRASTETSPK